MRDIESVMQWTVYVIVTAFAVGLMTLGTVFFIDTISSARARDACGESGGKVEHYDPQHDSLWRCVKQAERAP